MAKSKVPDVAPLTCAELRELDRRAIEDYGVPSVVLMENAGRGAAEVVLACLEPEGSSLRDVPRVAIACGPGNNGGDGCVVARHLANAGVEVALFATEPLSALHGDAAVMRAIVERMRLEIHDVGSAEALARAEPALARCDLFVDGLLGTGFSGSTVRPKIARVIERLNALRAERRSDRFRGRRTIALDLPSGLDADRGVPAVPTIVADVTLTFAAPKVGFRAAGSESFVGRLVVVAIGAPAELVGRVRGAKGRGV